jgi:hypothetical protein
MLDIIVKTVLMAYFGGIYMMFSEVLDDFRPKFFGVP